MIILVASHPRSGTHFMIDSIVNNVENAEFPFVRPSFLALENLVHPHDKAIVDEWEKQINSHESRVLVVKTHMLPEEITGAMERPGMLGGEREQKLFKTIWNQSRKVYINRGVEDTLTSLYHYSRRIDIQFHKSRVRMKKMEFSEFLRSPNFLIYPCRSFQAYDENKVTFWAYHSEQWGNTCDAFVTYENLRNDFANTLEKVAEDIKISDMLIRPVKQVMIIKDPNPGLFNSVKKHFFRLRRKVNRNTAVFARKGVVGDHKNIFSQADHEFVAQYAGQGR